MLIADAVWASVGHEEDNAKDLTTSMGRGRAKHMWEWDVGCGGVAVEGSNIEWGHDV